MTVFPSLLGAQAPWNTDGGPEGLEESWWARLLELRDTRVELERRADDAWQQACLVALAVEGLERDEADAAHRVSEALRRGLQLAEAERNMDLDGMLLYRLSHGQVDVPEPSAALMATAKVVGGGGSSGGATSSSALHAMQGARFLKRTAVERVNDAILVHGADRVRALGCVYAASIGFCHGFYPFPFTCIFLLILQPVSELMFPPAGRADEGAERDEAGHLPGSVGEPAV